MRRRVLVDELIGATLEALILGLGAALVLTSYVSLLASSQLPGEALESRVVGCAPRARQAVRDDEASRARTLAP